MKQHRYSGLVLASALLMGACTEDPVQPAAAVEEGVSHISGRSSAVSESANDLAIFSNRIPAGFADKVEALGGKVELMVSAAGAALVSGLDEAAVAALHKDKSISSVGPESMVQMPDARVDLLSLASAD